MCFLGLLYRGARDFSDAGNYNAVLIATAHFDNEFFARGKSPAFFFVLPIAKQRTKKSVT